VFVVARWLKDVLTRNGIAGEHVTVSRHGLSDDMKSIHRAAAQRRSSRDPSAPLTVGFVGRFTKVKGCHVLVKAVRALPEEVRVETQLYGMAQNDKDEAYLQRLKRQAAGEPRIQFCGPMTGENRIEAFASFDVLAVPSLWFETGPYTVLEAFAANLPVLGSNHGGIEERMEDGRSGVLVPPGDVEEWTNALSRLYHRHTTGRWEWNLPVLRSSRDVAREIEDIYKKQK
jgi:glycosyltransferase involved in cell wall biosynthesis